MFASWLICVTVIVLFGLVRLIGFVRFKGKYCYWPLPQPPATLSLLYSLMYGQFAVRSLCAFVQSPLFVALAPVPP